MPDLPPELADHLPAEDVETLRQILPIIGDELAAVYEMDASFHEEAIGDNAQLFGLKIWHHLWFALGLRRKDLGSALIIDDNHSHHLRIGSLRVAIHKLGDREECDIHSSFPDNSATQRAYGERNDRQLSLFNADAVVRLAPERAYALRDLVIGHFGNPRDALVKWYVGAYVLDEDGIAQWAWVYRQDDPGGGKHRGQQRPPTKPFDQRKAPDVNVEPRRRNDERRHGEHGATGTE